MLKNFLPSFILLTFLVFFNTSCSSDDDGSQESPNGKLLGTWELKENRNTAIPRSIEAPTDEDPIVITFFDTDFNGRTANNTFFGNYRLSGSTLTFLSFNSTEVNDTPWGIQFYNALQQAFNEDRTQINVTYEITSGTMTWEYAPDQLLYFEKQ